VSQSPNRAAIQRISELLSEEIPNEGELTSRRESPSKTPMKATFSNVLLVQA